MKINELVIFTSQLEEQLHFYTQRLRLPLLEQTSNSFKVAVGSSILVFKHYSHTFPYHIAINIPSNQDMEALVWLQDRVELLSDNGTQLVDFKNWNAKSIYFYDADHNIIEFISRKNLGIQNKDPFNYHALLEISEVGVPVNDIQSTYEDLQELSKFPIYDGDFKRFCAVGDETGLFIIIDKNKKKWFPTNDVAYSSNFELKFENQGQELELEFYDGRLSFV
ncbi:MAG TPA: hypothetical protein VKA27_16120 [Sunxiuqinia sp.]|nr:hypothetical protein [Sunxiuqinia sp.]